LARRGGIVAGIVLLSASATSTSTTAITAANELEVIDHHG
jgi:hypothetical protein